MKDYFERIYISNKAKLFLNFKKKKKIEKS